MCFTDNCIIGSMFNERGDVSNNAWFYDVCVCVRENERSSDTVDVCDDG